MSVIQNDLIIVLRINEFKKHNNIKDKLTVTIMIMINKNYILVK